MVLGLGQEMYNLSLEYLSVAESQEGLKKQMTGPAGVAQ